MHIFKYCRNKCMFRGKICQITIRWISQTGKKNVSHCSAPSFVFDRTQVHGGRPAIIISRLLILLWEETSLDALGSLKKLLEKLRLRLQMTNWHGKMQKNAGFLTHQCECRNALWLVKLTLNWLGMRPAAVLTADIELKVGKRCHLIPENEQPTPHLMFGLV